MYRKKIIRILETFEEREWRACYKYLKYCSKKSAQSLKVFEYIYKTRKNLASEKLLSSQVRKKVLPLVSDRAFLNVLSELVKDVETYMILDELRQEDNAFERKQFLSSVYKKKGRYIFFEKISKELIKNLESSKQIDLFDNLRWLQLHHSLYFSDLYNKNIKPLESRAKAEMRLDIFTQNLKLYYQSEAYSHRILSNDTSVVNIDDTDDLLSEIIKNLHQLITERNVNSYKYLEHRLFENSKFLSKELSMTILIALINYCYFQIKSGDVQIINNLAELQVFGMTTGLLLFNDRIDETRFLNIIDTISKSGLDISMEKLIPEWIKKVNSKNLKSVEQMAHALWAFGQKAYGRTLQILNNSDIRLTHRNLSFRARWMYICSLCSHYPDYDGKEEVLKSSLIFFKRHQHEMNEQTYLGSLNLVTVVRMIWENKQLEAIERFVDECDFIMFKSWIDRCLFDMRKSLNG